MAAAMNSPFMILRLAEPSFQGQVVLRHVHGGAYEKPGLEAEHQLRDVLRDRSLLSGESSSELLEIAMPLVQRTVGRVERVGNRLDLLHVLTHLGLGVGDEVQPTIDARR